jgi:DNA-binding Lrp family transcriptional regulator
MASESLMLDPIDRQILHALQISPRASFARMATVLDVSEQTVARRYQRLLAHGVVRVTALRDPNATPSLGMWTLRIGCRPGSALDLAEALARRADTSWVGVGAGGAEVSCQAMIDDEEAGAEGLLHQLPRASNVLTFSAHQMIHRFAGRGEVDWIARGYELGKAQRAALVEGTLVLGESNEVQSYTTTLLPSDAALMRALSRDGRASWATLASATGWSQRQAAHRVNELVAGGGIFFHLDVAHRVIGLRSVANLWFTVAPADLAAVGARLADHLELAFAGAMTGQTNIMASALCPDPTDLYRYITTKVAAIEGVRTVETVPQLTRLKQAFFRVENGRLREPPP